MGETLLVFAGFGTVLWKALHLWTKKIFGKAFQIVGMNLSEQEKNAPHLASRLTQARVTVPSPLVP